MVLPASVDFCDGFRNKVFKIDRDTTYFQGIDPVSAFIQCIHEMHGTSSSKPVSRHVTRSTVLF